MNSKDRTLHSQPENIVLGMTPSHTTLKVSQTSSYDDDPRRGHKRVALLTRRRASGIIRGMNERSRSVARVLSVLEQLSVSPKALSNHELAAALDIPASSMYRLLQKLVELGYVEFEPDRSTYAIAPRLGELGERLAEAGGHSPHLQRLLAELRASTGHTIAIWVPNGAHVRISALLVGRIPGVRSTSPGEIADAFSTPGLAIASQYSPDQVRAIVSLCRRRHASLGRRFHKLADIEKALAETRQRGHAVGYNMRSDGWGMLAWPIPLTSNPLRLGALSLGAQVPVLRREETRLVTLAQRLLATYRREQKGFTAVSATSVPQGAPTRGG